MSTDEMQGIRVEGLCKSYGSVRVLQSVDMIIAPARVRALLGPNGAGKSTVVKCLAGAISIDSGRISVDGRAYSPSSPARARHDGVSVIHQNFSLADSLSAVDNIFLGHERTRFGWVDRRSQRSESEGLLARLGVQIDLDRPVGAMRVSDRQLVEIAKGLSTSPRLLLLDEPTASLSDQESLRLIALVRALAGQGISILYVTHRLREVFEVADDVTVVRDGRVVLDEPVAGLTMKRVVAAIVGERHAAPGLVTFSSGGAPIMEVCDLPIMDRSISFEVRAGEVLGLFGHLGSGTGELLHSVFADRSAGGVVKVDGMRVKGAGPSAAIAVGIALVPGDRAKHGLFGPLPSSDNVLMPQFRHHTRHGFRKRTVERHVFASLARGLRVHPSRGEALARTLSGGNQQKLVVGRWLGHQPRTRVLLLDHPTQGVDVGARADLYGALRSFASDDRAVVMATTEADEAICACDRILVVCRGAVVGDLCAADATEDLLMRLADGVPVDA